MTTSTPQHASIKELIILKFSYKTSIYVLMSGWSRFERDDLHASEYLDKRLIILKSSCKTPISVLSRDDHALSVTTSTPQSASIKELIILKSSIKTSNYTLVSGWSRFKLDDLRVSAWLYKRVNYPQVLL